MPSLESEAFWVSFNALDTFIVHFQQVMPPFDAAVATSVMTRTVFVTHSLAYAATIQLHSILARGSSASKDKCLFSASMLAGLIRRVNLRDFKRINPIMGVSVDTFI